MKIIDSIQFFATFVEALNLKVVGLNPTPATKLNPGNSIGWRGFTFVGLRGNLGMASSWQPLDVISGDTGVAGAFLSFNSGEIGAVYPATVRWHRRARNDSSLAVQHTRTVSVVFVWINRQFLLRN
jgi:hypothetical protein